MEVKWKMTGKLRAYVDKYGCRVWDLGFRD